MPGWTISQVAREVRLRPSAIRYYERIGLLPPAQRLSGQRRYDSTVLYRLAIIHRARQLGFTLNEIRQLFFGFRDVTRASQRWRTLSARKLAELDHLMDGIKAVRALLKKMMTRCRCDTLDQCGKGIFESMDPDQRFTSLTNDAPGLYSRHKLVIPSERGRAKPAARVQGQGR
jgi:MerR family transcriptional regulator, redox-sensitive transcriptional activator SoxR